MRTASSGAMVGPNASITVSADEVDNGVLPGGTRGRLSIYVKMPRPRSPPCDLRWILAESSSCDESSLLNWRFHEASNARLHKSSLLAVSGPVSSKHKEKST